jgi:hypothetical protein
MTFHEIALALLILVVPLVLHFNLLFGSAILDKVTTPSASFNSFYNRLPWVLSTGAGVFFAAAYLARAYAVPSFILLGVGLLAFIVDAAAAGISFYGWVYNSPRRNRKR